MADSIFDSINSTALATYWVTKEKEHDPYIWDTLFPTIKQESADFSFYRGVTNAPKPLAPSAHDAQAIMRDRQGFGEIRDHTRFFKEGKYIDENLQNELDKLSQYGTQLQKDIISSRIMDDSAELIEGASLTREIMRNQLVQTGKVKVFGNGQQIEADYLMKDNHLATSKVAWGTDGSTPFDDIQKAKDVVADDSGQTISRAVMNTATFRMLLSDTNVKSSMLYDMGNLRNVSIPQSELLSFLVANYNLDIELYDKTFNDNGVTTKFVPDGRVIFLPEGALGKTIMSVTPEERSLLSAPGTDVSIVDTGVAIKTIMESDPVTKETIVSQKVMPSFEQIDAVYNLNVAPTGSVTPPEGNGNGTEAPEA